MNNNTFCLVRFWNQGKAHRCYQTLLLPRKRLSVRLIFRPSSGQYEPARLIVFKHDSKLDNAPSHKLLEGITLTKNEGVEVSPSLHNDYTVTIPDSLRMYCKENKIELIERI